MAQGYKCDVCGNLVEGSCSPMVIDILPENLGMMEIKHSKFECVITIKTSYFHEADVCPDCKLKIIKLALVGLEKQ